MRARFSRNTVSRLTWSAPTSFRAMAANLPSSWSGRCASTRFQLHSKGLGRAVEMRQHRLLTRVGGVRHHGGVGEPGQDLAQNLQALADEIRRATKGPARDIGPPGGQARDKPKFHRVGVRQEHDGDRGGGVRRRRRRDLRGFLRSVSVYGPTDSLRRSIPPHPPASSSRYRSPPAMLRYAPPHSHGPSTRLPECRALPGAPALAE